METIGINTHTGNTHADVSWSFQDRYIKQVRYKPLQLFNHLGLHNLSVIQHSDNSLLFMICLFPLRHDGRLYVPFFFLLLLPLRVYFVFSRVPVKFIIVLLYFQSLLSRIFIPTHGPFRSPRTISIYYLPSYSWRKYRIKTDGRI